MALKTFRPLTPSRRFMALPSFEEITTHKPEKSLCEIKLRTGGRNNRGRKTSRHRGGGHKKLYRIIDFKRLHRNMIGEILTVEYDPNRSSRICLVQYPNGTKTYILAPNGITVGTKITAGENVDPTLGNSLPLKSIPLGSLLHNIELTPGRGGQIVRSAGSQAILNNRESGYALIKMASGELRRINEECYATIGQVSNVEHMNVSSGKAGRNRWLGIRPQTRGMAMNPVDHPMGGGQGKSKGGGGRHHPMSPWGQLSKGFKTRAKRKASDQFIIQRRKKK